MNEESINNNNANNIENEAVVPQEAPEINENAEETLVSDEPKQAEESLEPVVSIDYLDSKILDMKTIDIKEIESEYGAINEIDTSIYDKDIVDIKQNRIVKGKVVNITDRCIFVDKSRFLQLKN